jgi:hypothetical protein
MSINSFFNTVSEMHKNNMTIETRNPKNGKKPGGRNLKKNQQGYANSTRMVLVGDVLQINERSYFLNNIIKKKLVERAKVGHG